MHTLFAVQPPRRAAAGRRGHARGFAVLAAVATSLALAAGAAALPGAAHAADAPRVIEMVSPPDTSGQSAEPGGALGISEPPLLGDGVFVGFNLLTPLFPEQGNGWGTLWQSRRGATGWVRGLMDEPPEIQTGDEAFVAQAVTPDASRAVIFSYASQSLFNTGPPVKHVAPSRLTLREADGTMRPIVSIPFPIGEQTPVPLAVTGTSRDLGTVQFNTLARLAGDAHTGFGYQSYIWRDGTLRVSGVDADGAPLRCGGASAGDVPHPPVSADGAVAYVNYAAYDAVQGCGTPTHLAAYVGGRTWPVNDPAPGQPGLFGTPALAGTSPDGLTAWFTQRDPITPDDANVDLDLYRSDLPAGGGQATVRCVTCSAPDAQVGRADITGDRRHVVFSAANAVDGQGVDGAPGGNLLVLSDDGGLELITSATLVPDYKVTPDARFIVATSSDRLTAYDNQGLPEIYRFARRAGGGGYDVTCVSCDPTGAPPVAGSSYRSTSGLTGVENRPISADGRTIAFVSRDALLPAAVAGVMNLYEWTDGRLTLLHTGLSDADPKLLGVSPSGDDVYFDAYGFVTTESRQPTDSIYDARRGGGFPGPPSVAAPCVASACQGAPSAPPALPVAATVRLTGEAVPSAPLAAPRRPARVAKKVVRGSTVRVDVVAPAKGRITVSGAHVRTGARSVAKAGTYGVAVTLTAKAKRTLKRAGRLSVRLKVTFRPAAGSATTATVTVTVKK